MHLLESYALQAGQPIGEPSLPVDFYPLPYERYITFQPFSKPAKNYDYWNEVLELLLPLLEKLNIKIVQIGAKEELALPGCFHAQGLTTLSQVNYIIKHSILHFGADSFAQHMAGVNNIPCVGIYSNNKVENVRPYWGDRDKQIFLHPYEENELPYYVLDEQNKRINKIKPEKIFLAICKLLTLDVGYDLETVLFGRFYNHRLLESVPTEVYNPKQLGMDTLCVRMDVFFNEENLLKQAQICPINIITNKPINENLLKSIRPRINQLFYVIDENHDPKFAKVIHKLGVHYQMYSYMSEDALNKIKLDYCEYGLIVKRTPFDPNSNDLTKGQNLLFKTNKYIIFNKDLYLSYAHLNAGQKMSSLNDRINPVKDDPEFWKDSEHFYLLKPANTP